nr:LasI [uncultured Verrucomicrobiota bacterium]UWK15770.1 LasI [uncultured Verrucomicrobiota bacterium]
MCIVGGGPTGIGLAKEFGEAGIPFDLLEAEADFGGVWNRSARCGRVYDSAHLISPKSNTQFSDFPMPADYPDYPSHRQMLAYIRSYARRFGVYEGAVFNASVVRLSKAAGGWRVGLASGEERDYGMVYVCNGAQRVAQYPDPPIRGPRSFEEMHSLEYRSPSQLRGKRVLVMGAGNSGCDIVIDAVHHAEAVYLSARRGYYFQPKYISGKPTPEWMMELGSKFETREETLAYIREVFKLAGFEGADYGLRAPDYPLDACHPVMNSQLLYHVGHGDVGVKGDVERFDGREVVFCGGDRVEVDLVLYATGYRRQLDFLDPRQLEWRGGLPDLFLHMMPRNHDDLFFYGYYNLVGGLGNVVRMVSLFAVDYIRARQRGARGYRNFLEAKRKEDPDLGRGYFVNSLRHRWEVDLWKFLKVVNRYRGLINEQ